MSRGDICGGVGILVPFRMLWSLLKTASGPFSIDDCCFTDDPTFPKCKTCLRIEKSQQIGRQENHTERGRFRQERLIFRQAICF